MCCCLSLSTLNPCLDGKNRESKEAETALGKIFERLKNTKSVVHLAKVNTDREHEIMNTFPIKAIPSFRLFKNGKRYDYAGR